MLKIDLIRSSNYDGKKEIRTTEKGKEFMKGYREVVKILNSD